MATAYYAQPAAANYYTPSAASFSQQKQRGYRVCDQCGAVETPAARFRLCGGCMATNYCSSNCQKMHWAAHKTICQHTQGQVANAKEQQAHGEDKLTSHLRKFTSLHQGLLSWAGFQALQLKHSPGNIHSQALIIDLRYNPTAESHRRFSIQGAHVVSRSYINDPLVNADIARRDERCRRSGGLGAAVVMVNCSGVSQVMPVEVDAPTTISWDDRRDWAQVVAHFIESGRTDFKPISTTPRGVVYQ